LCLSKDNILVGWADRSAVSGEYLIYSSATDREIDGGHQRNAVALCVVERVSEMPKGADSVTVRRFREPIPCASCCCGLRGHRPVRRIPLRCKGSTLPPPRPSNAAAALRTLVQLELPPPYKAKRVFRRLLGLDGDRISFRLRQGHKRSGSRSGRLQYARGEPGGPHREWNRHRTPGLPRAPRCGSLNAAGPRARWCLPSCSRRLIDCSVLSGANDAAH
jgi:hypothetical protein